MWGIISPTQPIRPPRHTAAALSSVEAKIRIIRQRRTLIPRLRASSSSRVSRLIRHRSRKIRISPTTMGSALQRKASVSAFFRLPISQKVIFCRVSVGSETYLIMVTPALHRAMTMEPVRTRLRICEWADFRLTR